MGSEALSKQDSQTRPIPAPRLGVDLRTAVLLAGAYGVAGAAASLLLLPLIAQHTDVKLPVPPPLFAILLAIQLTVVYGLLGWAGLRMARGRGLEPAPILTTLWQGGGLRMRRGGLLQGTVGGLVAGAALLLAVWSIRRAFPGTLPQMLHPPSVASALAASTAASFGEEILCRLFLLSAIQRLLPRNARWAPATATLVSSLAFGGLHTPGMVMLYGGLAVTPPMAWVWIISLNAFVGTIFGGLYLRRGIGAAITAHWFCDLVWHVGSVAA
jgi:hypothetical protein